MADESVRFNLVDPAKIASAVRVPAMRATTRIIAKRARQIAPVGETGKLKRSIRTSVKKRGLSAAVLGKTRYAWAVTHGTKRHFIKPKKGHVLIIAGHIISGRGVWHPGAKAQPFLHDAAEQSRGKLQAELHNIVDKPGGAT